MLASRVPDPQQAPRVPCITMHGPLCPSDDSLAVFSKQRLFVGMPENNTFLGYQESLACLTYFVPLQ